MPKKQRVHKQPSEGQKLVRVAKRGSALIIVSLIAIAFVLIFRIGEGLMWVIEKRTQIIGVVLLALFFLLLWYPIMIEVTSNPRPLSGPGKNPKGPNLPQ
jgi:uncharacterized RDD family membrane protein YckC